jgi:hypothetical protein
LGLFLGCKTGGNLKEKKEKRGVGGHIYFTFQVIYVGFFAAPYLFNFAANIKLWQGMV